MPNGVMHFRALCFLCLAAVFGISAWSFSEEEKTISPTYTLDDVYRSALKTNERVALARAEIKRFRYAYRETLAGVLPSLRLSAEGTRYGKEVSFADRLLQPRNDWDYDVTLDQPLYSFGRARMTLKQAGRQSEVRRQDARAVIQKVLLDVTRQYMEALKAQDRVRIAEEGIGLAKEHKRVADSFFRAGEVDDTEPMRADIALLDAERELVEAEGALRISLSRLKASAGLPTEVFRLQEPPAVPDEAEETDLTEMLFRASRYRPELKALDEAVEIAVLEHRKTRRNYFPVFLSRFQYHEQKEGFIASFASASLVLQWNLFDGGRREAQIGAAHVLESESMFQKSLIQKEISLDVRNQREQVRILEKTLDIVERQKALAGKNYDHVKHRYAVGEVASLDEMDARQTLLRTESLWSATRRDLFLAHVTLKRALGTLGETEIQ